MVADEVAVLRVPELRRLAKGLDVPRRAMLGVTELRAAVRAALADGVPVVGPGRVRERQEGGGGGKPRR